MSICSKKKLAIKAQYDNVFANKKCTNSKYFKVYWRENNLGFARLGVSVAKRNINKAVARNRLKRLVKESFNLTSNKLAAVDIIFIVKKDAGNALRNNLFDELNSKWNHFAILNNK